MRITRLTLLLLGQAVARCSWGHILIAILAALIAPGDFQLAQARATGQNTVSTEVSEKEAEAPPSRFKGEWRIRLRNFQFEEDVEEGNVTNFRVQARGVYELAPFFDLAGTLSLDTFSSRVQTRFNSTGGENGIYLQNLVARVRPIEQIQISAGAIGQRYLDGGGMLVSSTRAFPGLKEELRLGNNFASIVFSAQQSIPTSATLESERSEKEDTPRFYAESVHARVNFKNIIKAKAFGTHFKFENLPSTVAFDSSRYGNTVQGENEANSQFFYDFDGWMAGWEACFCYPYAFKPKAGMIFIENSEAEEASNRGMMMQAKVDMGILGSIVTPYYRKFFMESDVTPAYYNGSVHGHNNRDGQAYGLEILFKKWNFKLVGEFVDSEPINETPFQDSFKSSYFGVETVYVEF